MTFSPKQRKVLQWWQNGSQSCELDAIICDGAVRSGKTLSVGLSFFLWGMCSFSGRQFGICGKTIISVRRNLVVSILPMLRSMGFRCEEKVSQNQIVISGGGRSNTFYLFGGKDEGAASLIQGITLAGALLDEVALMPRSFVEQTLARCSVQGSKLWFSCNPESPNHWFYQEWILGKKRERALYLTFTMEDNPSLTEKVRERYRAMFEGAFYRRFVLGEWVCAEGLVYDFFSQEMVKPPPVGVLERYYVSCDYGTVNPTSMGLWGLKDGVWYRLREYYYNSKEERAQKTDSEYADALEKLVVGIPLEEVIVDPSAASFIEVLRRRGFRVRRAKNEVLRGIRTTAELLKSGGIVLCEDCHNALREMGLYRWDTREGGEDKVCKEYDHAMDEMRYFAMTIATTKERKRCFAGAVERGNF
ncbi:MAG: PBSX family phage terminase large subunit [Eubacteriales bacterium]